MTGKVKECVQLYQRVVGCLLVVKYSNGNTDVIPKKHSNGAEMFQKRHYKGKITRTWIILVPWVYIK